MVLGLDMRFLGRKGQKINLAAETGYGFDEKAPVWPGLSCVYKFVMDWGLDRIFFGFSCQSLAS
jgi:hypothetical protein